MKKTILTIAAIVIATVSAFSQSVTETRQIKTTALQMYENYKVVMSGLYSRSPYTEDNFMALFESKAVIYNDILPDNQPQQLLPSDYFEKFKESIQRIYPTFSDFKMGEPVSVGNKWQIQCTFTRGTRFRTQQEMNYPEWSFNYTVTIEMDKSYHIINKVYQNARIVSVDVENPLKGFFVLENKRNMPLVTKSGERLNVWDEEYQSHIFPEDKWNIYDMRVLNNDHIFEFSKSRFSQNKTDAHFYQPDVQRFNKNIFGIGVNYTLLTAGNKMSGENAENFKDILQTGDALSLSMFYGKQMVHKDKSTVFFNFGLDFNKYSHSYSGINNTTYQTVDADGDSYLRKIKIDALNEKINMIAVSVPLSVEYLYQLTEQTKKPIFLSFELGVFAEYTLSSSSTYNLNADYRGEYNYFGGVEFDHYYDYGKFEFKGEKQDLAKSFDGGIFGGIGLWFALNESNLLKFNVSYKHSLNSPLEYKEDYVIIKSNPQTKPKSKDDEPYQSLLHSTKQGMQNIGIGLSWVKTIGGKK